MTPKTTLANLEGLLTATEWEKAAIVAAYVDTDLPGTFKHTSAKVSAAKFAALGINGLKSKATVTRYAQAWKATGLPIPAEGEEVTLPTMPFSEALPPTHYNEVSTRRNQSV